MTDGGPSMSDRDGGPRLRHPRVDLASISRHLVSTSQMQSSINSLPAIFSLRAALLQLHSHIRGGEVDGRSDAISRDLRLALAQTNASISLERLRAPLEEQEMFALSQA